MIARAEGELNIYNWGNYTSPDLITKFEEAYEVKVTITDYNSNDTALAKVKAGAHGFDVVVPSSANFVPIWIKEGLLLESRPDQMENFKNVEPRWIDVRVSIPAAATPCRGNGACQAVSANTELLSRASQHPGHHLEPPPELAGKINVVPEMTDILSRGGDVCRRPALHRRQEAWRKVRHLLTAASPAGSPMNYGTVEATPRATFANAGLNGCAFRARLQNPADQVRLPQGRLPGLD